MSSTIVQRLIGLISGEVGGNIAGAILKKFSLGPIGNTIAGILGGGLGEQFAQQDRRAAKRRLDRRYRRIGRRWRRCHGHRRPDRERHG
jgi:hypothetical protein